MKKSGLADSPFFQAPPQKIEAVIPPSATPLVQKVDSVKVEKLKKKKSEQLPIVSYAMIYI
jgi:hypothetical protein